MQKKEVQLTVKQSVENFLKENNIFSFHDYLPSTLKALANSHLQAFPQSKIRVRLDKIAQLVEALKKVDKTDIYEWKGQYLVWLTSIAEELQALQCFQAQDLVLLGKTLSKVINNYVQEGYGHSYLRCTLERESSIAYGVSNLASISSAAGLIPVVSGTLLDGAITPFAQHETKAFGLLEVGFKKRLAEANAAFSECSLCDCCFNRTVTRFQKARIGEKHRDQFINVFQAVYTRSSGSGPASDATGTTVVIIGGHGNASRGADMTKYLDEQADAVFKVGGGKIDRVVALSPDYPGSAASGGKFATIQELALDSFVLLVSHLVDKGVDPSQIICLGHSLGGAVLVEADHQLAEKNIVPTIVSINSFSRIQKFTGDSPILAWLALKQYNIPASQYFQEHDKDRRFVRHSKDDEVIPLETCSLMGDLEANKGGVINEGILIEEGGYKGHALSAHDIKDVIIMVGDQQLAFQRREDQKLLRHLHSALKSIIKDQTVESQYYQVSRPEFPTINRLTTLQTQYTTLIRNLGVNEITIGLDPKENFGSLEKSRWNLKVLLGFIHTTRLELGGVIEQAESKRGYFQRVDPVVAALMVVKSNLDSLLSKNYLGSLPLSLEMMSHYKEIFEDHLCHQDCVRKSPQ